jgi:hypothetical protein
MSEVQSGQVEHDKAGAEGLKLLSNTISNHVIRSRLLLVASVKTPGMGVINRIVRVGSDAVVVQSERTGTERTVTYGQLRDAPNQTRNGVIVRTLAQVVGLYKP